jgi:hypothetical protein
MNKRRLRSNTEEFNQFELSQALSLSVLDAINMSTSTGLNPNNNNSSATAGNMNNNNGNSPDRNDGVNDNPGNNNTIVPSNTSSPVVINNAPLVTPMQLEALTKSYNELIEKLNKQH